MRAEVDLEPEATVRSFWWVNQGRTYTTELFFAHRRVALESLFHMRTNMQLVTGTMPTVLAFYD